MEKFDILIFPIFNLVFGLFLMLKGFRILPIKDEENYNKYKTFFIIGGIVLFLGGFLKLI